MKTGSKVTVRSSPGEVIRTLTHRERGDNGAKHKFVEVRFDSGRVSTYPAGEVRKCQS